MEADEREMLIRVDEHMRVFVARHDKCDIPCRLKNLENDRNKIVGALLLIAAVSTLNTIIDLTCRFILHKPV